MNIRKKITAAAIGVAISIPTFMIAAEDHSDKGMHGPKANLGWAPYGKFRSHNPPGSQNQWYRDGQKAVQENAVTAMMGARNSYAKAKNIIVFLGDGMGVSTVTAARIFAGQQNGGSGEENELFFETFPHLALSKTYNTNQQTPDSAGTMSAIMTGVKTKAGLISVDETVVLEDCSTQTPESEIVTALELAEIAGMSTGVVTTTRITHATPAATYAHIMSRNFEDDRDAAGMDVPGDCSDIAKQMIELPNRFNDRYSWVDGLEVALGGGRRGFVPRVDANGDDVIEPVSGVRGERLDLRNLTDEWVQNYSNASYVTDRDQLNAINTNNVDHLLGLFNMSSMQYEADRAGTNEPSISEMTSSAIKVLDNNRKGYFLMVEGARIDHAHHGNNPYRALTDAVAFADAVKTAYEMTDPKETLIIVTADHSHVMTLGAYATRGNPILAHVVTNDGTGEANTSIALASDGLPYMALGYANGLGYLGDPMNPGPWGRVDTASTDTTDPDYTTEVLVPTFFESHGGEDVAIYASGPGSSMVSGLMEQNAIFHVMHRAGKLDVPRRTPRRAPRRRWGR